MEIIVENFVKFLIIMKIMKDIKLYFMKINLKSLFLVKICSLKKKQFKNLVKK